MMKRTLFVLLVLILMFGVMTIGASAETVTADSLNVRSGPGTEYDRVGSLPNGTQVTILETKTVDDYVWGKINLSDGQTGWIRLDYTDYIPPSQQSPGKWSWEGGKWYYYIDGVKATGWQMDRGKWYYMNSSGVMQTGWLYLWGSWYFLNSSGAMQTGWLQQGADRYYLRENGTMAVGWVQIEDDWYYMRASGTPFAGWLQSGSAWYYLDTDGKMVTGKIRIGEIAHKFDKDGIWLGETTQFTSDACLDLIKLEEGFSATPYWDYSQWTVGYGTLCPADKLTEYQTNGISEEDAEKLLRQYLETLESELDSFIAKNSLAPTQNQYDALVMFTYNVGSGWCWDPSGTFHQAIVKGATGNELIGAFALWCKAGGEFKDFLMRRRLSEANMYLNGLYSETPPENYCYVLLDANGGTVSRIAVAYDAGLGAVSLPVPTYSGKEFFGWYTAKVNGKQVTAPDASHNATTLYAAWEDQTPSDRPIKITVNTDSVNLRTGPGVEHDRLADKPQANTGDQLTITETFSGPTLLWGKFTEHGGGWICLTDYTNYDAALEAAKTSNAWVEKEGSWYYYKGLKKQTGWLYLYGLWYYLDSDGIMQTGWIKLGNVWYYLKANGAMATGWCKADGTYYYFSNSGAMCTGWLQEGSTWYYLKPGGAMATGWCKVSGTYYYFNSSGAMRTGWLREGNTWYYLKPGGAMATGWLKLGSNWFYFEPSGAMVTGEKIIGPTTYYFDKDGYWIP